MNELTPYQKKKQIESRAYWQNIAMNTAPVDKEQATKAIANFRGLLGMTDVPQYIWCETPRQCFEKLAALDRMKLPIGRCSPMKYGYLNPYRGTSIYNHFVEALRNFFRDMPNDRSRESGHVKLCPNESRVLTQYTACDFGDTLERRGTRESPLNLSSEWSMTSSELEIISDLIRNTHFFLNFPHVVIHCERPTLISIDDSKRLHSKVGPAAMYGSDKTDVDATAYYIHGIQMSQRKYIDDPKTITPGVIDGTRNIEVRRTFMEMYGVDRYLQNTGAQVISEGKYGKRLWWRAPENGSPEEESMWKLLRRRPEPLVLVEVINSTAEPDGSFKRYFLRVPPGIRDADEAVAWTFRLKKEEYHPDVET